MTQGLTEAHHTWVHATFGINPSDFSGLSQSEAPQISFDMEGLSADTMALFSALTETQAAPTEPLVPTPGPAPDTSAVSRPASGPVTAPADPSGPLAPQTPLLPNIPIAPGLSIPVEPLVNLLKSEFGELRALVNIYNNTDQTLHLQPPPPDDKDSGEYQRKPPEKIGPKTRNYFQAVSTSKIGFSVTGIDHAVIYAIDDPSTGLKLHFQNPRNLNPLQGAQNWSEADVFGVNDDKYQVRATRKGQADAQFDFILEPAGTAPPSDPVNPVNPPGPGPAPAVNANCLITVTNNTQSVLTLSGTGNERGNFMTQPATTLAPNGTTQFVFVQTPNDKDNQPGCKGFITWDVGSPSVATWRNEWDNPVGAKNTGAAPIDPQGLGFKSLPLIGQGDENVPFSFTLSGSAQPGPGPGPGPAPGPGPGPAPGPGPGPAPGPGPGPGPSPEPGPQPEPSEWDPPAAGASSPTLRQGDKSPDGWVEYLQEVLTTHGAKIEIDGAFGPKTYAAVVKFQTDKKLTDIDGIVGEETWAALRQASPVSPGTDGRKPHSYEDKQADARFALETKTVGYQTADDTVIFAVVEVGEKSIAGYYCHLRISPPGGEVKTIKIKLDKPYFTPTDGQGAYYRVVVPDFRKIYPSVPADAPVTGYQIDAYLDREIGGDTRSVTLIEK